MPRGFLRSVTTSRGWRMTMEKMPVQRSVLARLPFVQVCSLHFTWKELSEIRTTLVTSTETLRSPTTLKGSRSEERTSELQSLMRISYAVFCLKKKKQQPPQHTP